MSIPVFDPEYSDEAWWDEIYDYEDDNLGESTTIMSTTTIVSSTTEATPRAWDNEWDNDVPTNDCAASCLVALIVVVMMIVVMCLFVIACLAARYRIKRRERLTANVPQGPVVKAENETETPKELEVKALQRDMFSARPLMPAAMPPPYCANEDPVPPPQYSPITVASHEQPQVHGNERSPQYLSVIGGVAFVGP